MKEAGLYIHIPFCKRKCLYCDFNSYENRESDAEAYVKALVKEIEMYGGKDEITYKTVFIGGGTPTFINYSLMGSIMEAVSSHIAHNAEISMECNPGTVTPESLRYYKSIGINRLSIGLQAWQDSLLKKIGRIHSLPEFLYTFKSARKAGFDNINVDLMFALPDQTMDMWMETLKNICSLGVEHISCYSLKLEEGTRMYDMYRSKIITLPDEDTDREMYYHAIDILNKFCYEQYEISNFAKPGFQCRHNIIYWHNEEYIGVGAGSHSKVGSRRYWNEGDIGKYIRIIEEGEFPVEGEELISKEEEMWETMFLALRLNEGLNIKAFEEKYNIDFSIKYGGRISKLQSMDLIYIEDNRLKLTGKGRDLSNSVFVELM